MCRPRLFHLLALAAFPAPSARAAAIGVTTDADELNADGDCSLREAIRAANLNAAVDACPAGDGTDTIALSAGIYTLTIAGFGEDAALSGDLDITDSLTITGALSTTTVLEGSRLDNVLDIISGTTILAGVTVRNGLDGVRERSGTALTIADSSISGNRYTGVESSGALTITRSLISNNTNGGVKSYGRALISGSTFWNNQADSAIDSNGGGIDNFGIMLLASSTVISNTAIRGGGIANRGSLTVTDSLISDNLALPPASGGIFIEPGVGGGIFNSIGVTLTVESSSIVRNRAVYRAGGISSMGVTQISNSTIANNAAIGNNGGSASAGGIEHKGNKLLTLTASIVRDNTATDAAGGIMAQGSAVINESAIISNTAGKDGGGIVNFGLMTVSHSSISHNRASAGGGGITNAPFRGNPLLVLSETTISDNTAVRGAGIDSTSALRMTGSAIISNTATEDGGGIYTRNTTSVLTATNSTISGNSAARSGGGIYNITGTLSLYNTTIAHNTADSDADSAGDGGGIMRASGTVALQNSILGANADRGGQAHDCAGSLLSLGYNLLQNAAGCTITGGAGDIVGQPPLLGPLGDNDGPTLTHALLLDSPAIDAGDPAGCRDAQGIPLTTDQRGAARPQGGACDIGAFESPLTPSAATTTALSSSGSPTFVGETIFFTATVSTAAPGTPTGSVTLKDGATILATSPLSTSGQASFNTAALAPGSHNITAQYGGDASFSGATSPTVLHQVHKASATIDVTPSAQRSFLGQTVVFSVTVAANTSGTPTGTITLKNGATALRSCTLTGNLCTLATSTLATGHHAITAEYSGDAHFNAANSPAVTHVVLIPTYLPLIAHP